MQKLEQSRPPSGEDRSAKRRGARTDATSAGAHWLDSALGQTVLTEENRLLETAVRRLHGDTLLWAGVSAGTADLSRRSMVRHRIFGGAPGTSTAELERARRSDMAVYRAQLEELPLRNNCVDALVLHHTLEQCKDPRAALREAARVLQPGGQMVICAFNSLGSFSAWRMGHHTPDRYLNPLRLGDWLDVLGFESVVAPEYALYRPPLGLTRFDAARWDRVRNLLHGLAWPLGNVLLLHVRKKSLSIRPDWQAARARHPVTLVGAAYPKLVDTRRKVP